MNGLSFFDRIINGLALIAGALLVVLTSLICVDVIARYFRLFATPWTLDIAEYLLYIITFLGAPWVLRDGGHISIDLFVEQLSPGLRSRVIRLANALGAIVCLVLVYYSCRTLYRSYSQNVMVHETFVFPEWYLFTVAPPIFLILFVIFLRAALRSQELGATDRKSPGGF